MEKVLLEGGRPGSVEDGRRNGSRLASSAGLRFKC